MIGRIAFLSAVALLAVSCGASDTAATDPPSTASTPTTAAPTTTTSTTITPTTTTTVAGRGVVVTRCGAAILPLGSTRPVGEPVDDEAQAAFDEAGEAVAVEWFGRGGFGDGWTWLVVESDDDHIVFIGERRPDLAYAEIERVDDRWQAAGWGTCHFMNEGVLPGSSVGAWVTDPDRAPDRASSMLDVLVMERACAGGRAPEGRTITPYVFAGEDSIEIFVLIERVQGATPCPGNPWYATTVDLGEPLGDRVLIDGHVPPGLVRPWPPTESSLAGGDEE